MPVLTFSINGDRPIYERRLAAAGWHQTRAGKWHHERLNRNPHRPRLWTLEQAVAWLLDWEALDEEAHRGK